MCDVFQATILTKLDQKIVNFAKLNAKISLLLSNLQNGSQAHFKTLFTHLVYNDNNIFFEVKLLPIYFFKWVKFMPNCIQ